MTGLLQDKLQIPSCSCGNGTPRDSQPRHQRTGFIPVRPETAYNSVIFIMVFGTLSVV